MMEKGDYRTAAVAFDLSSQILYKQITGGDDPDAEYVDVVAQAEKDADLPINKFILACRQF